MTAPAAATVKSSSLIEDIIDVFHSPAAVFERRRTQGFGVALLIYTLISAAMLYAARPVMRPMIEKQIDQQIEKLQENPNISAEQKEAMGTRMRGMIDSPFAMIAPMFAFPIMILLTALVLWLVAKAFGSAASYGQAAMVTTFGAFPRLLLSVLLMGFYIATGREVSSQFALSLSPAAFLGDDASQVLAAALSRLDVGVIWHTLLLGIGIAIVGRTTRGQGLTAAVITWAIASLAVIFGAFRQMAG